MSYNLKAHMDIVISGLGCTTPMGGSPKELFENISKKTLSFTPMVLDGYCQKEISVGKLSTEQRQQIIHESSQLGLDDNHSWNTHLAIYSAMQALSDAEIDPGMRMGVIVANNDGHSDLLEQSLHTNILSPNYSATSTLEMIRTVTKSSGFSTMVFNTCASFNTALEIAVNLIEQNIHDTVLVGGTDLLAKKVLYGFDTLRALSLQPCKPFCRDRGAITISEGSAFVVLQRSDIARKRYCSVAGIGRNCDAAHPTAPNKESILLCHKMVFKKTKLSAKDISVLFAHGTGTIANDSIEASIVNELDYAAILCAPKTLLGHNMAACGAVAAVLIALTFNSNSVPMTSLYPDHHEFDLNYVNDANAHTSKINFIQSNSFGFGGNNAIAIFGA